MKSKELTSAHSLRVLNIICKTLGTGMPDNPQYLILQHLSNPVRARLKVFYGKNCTYVHMSKGKFLHMMKYEQYQMQDTNRQ